MNIEKASRNGALLVALFISTVIAILFVAPISQDLAYHGFADRRGFLGVANFGDSVSNFGFALVGCLGLWSIFGPGGRLVMTQADARPYITFFFGVVFVSIGSVYYHLAPDNDRLFWDRLPMTIAFMAIFYAILEDRLEIVAKRMRWLLPVMIALGASSLLYWDWTEQMGRGDLRFYALVQFFPILALPIICWLFPTARYTGGGYIFWIIFWYALAKALEYFDAQIFEILGSVVSGHSLKHMASAVATFMVWRMLARNAKSTPGK